MRRVTCSMGVSLDGYIVGPYLPVTPWAWPPGPRGLDQRFRPCRVGTRSE
ncbi:hypothetical protein ABZ642_06685 [Streptomyces sp. NPDC007157]